MFKKILLVILTVLLFACQPASHNEGPQPELNILAIQRTPSLGWMSGIMADCTQQIPGLAITVEETSAINQSLGAADVLFRWGLPYEAEYPTFTILEEELLVVIHPQNPLAALTREQLVGIYTGAIRTWDLVEPNLLTEEIRVLLYAPQDEAWQLFDLVMLTGAEPFFGSVLIPDPAAMLTEVSADPAAIGLLPTHWVSSMVKPVRIRDLPTGMRQPILAITQTVPSGFSRDWLLCVQEKTNQ